jgi:hypothetical protein
MVYSSVLASNIALHCSLYVKGCTSVGGGGGAALSSTASSSTSLTRASAAEEMVAGVSSACVTAARGAVLVVLRTADAIGAAL